MKIVERIKLARKLLSETNKEFGERFGRDESTVRDWENQRRNAPYQVIEFCEDIIEKLQICPACEGTGVFNTHQGSYVILFGDEAMENIFPIGKFSGVVERKRVPRLKMIAGKPEMFKNEQVPSREII